MVDEKRVKISADDNKVLLKAKLQETSLYKDQLKRNQQNELNHLEIKIVQKEREVAFKETELATGKITERHPDFVDDKKPEFFIRNDIDELNYSIKVDADLIVDLKRMMEDVDRGSGLFLTHSINVRMLVERTSKTPTPVGITFSFIKGLPPLRTGPPNKS